MKFCSACANPVEQTIPPGDNRLRYVCASCDVIHYQNPRAVVGCIPEWEDKILLCRRAIEPRYGLWTLPAGFMENGETTAEAGVRETLEEANARVEPLELFSLIDIPYLNQIYMLYRATLLDLAYSAGSESLEVELFTEANIPWDDIAFPAITETLTWYFEDRKRDRFVLHTGAIRSRPKRV
jgi:ADP-ribose pyrophosphatase YjhB (NUDIX family)